MHKRSSGVNNRATQRSTPCHHHTFSSSSVTSERPTSVDACPVAAQQLHLSTSPRISRHFVNHTKKSLYNAHSQLKCSAYDDRFAVRLWYDSNPDRSPLTGRLAGRRWPEQLPITAPLQQLLSLKGPNGATRTEWRRHAVVPDSSHAWNVGVTLLFL